MLRDSALIPILFQEQKSNREFFLECFEVGLFETNLDERVSIDGRCLVLGPSRPLELQSTLQNRSSDLSPCGALSLGLRSAFAVRLEAAGCSCVRFQAWQLGSLLTSPRRTNI